MKRLLIGLVFLAAVGGCEPATCEPVACSLKGCVEVVTWECSHDGATAQAEGCDDDPCPAKARVMSALCDAGSDEEGVWEAMSCEVVEDP